ncbi:4-hydroxythreonine-4-phosphate dehydrogenase PdxA [Flexibacterium corallicola]|uniref:4-hydroxythreonine-4-phosphate dehydrogenase PdxA n=1 Tax=Flexibacterium corallicola TaxID=3037259 RepID=UPI00286EC43E|nr:4-hydroxythreonine-4-phosphate dehydrogenase PdxA [Pseudovibrio sp. M1P-2-3]
MRRAKKALAVTMGDPSGIGPDITLLAWQERYKRDIPCFYLIADPAFIQERIKLLGLPMKIKETTPENARFAFDTHLPVVPLSGSVSASCGVPSSTNAALVLESIATAVQHVQTNRADAVVTNPICKSSLYSAGFKHPGHTEYLASLATDMDGVEPTPVMLLAGPQLMTVPLTVHIPLQEVPATLTEDLIIEKARIVHRDMKARFGLASPRLAICGLNPHAGENGTMGLEDRDVILPAIKKLQEEGIEASGPHPADTIFHPGARNSYDVVLAAYHDQALIPVKTIAFDETVNVTLGLPFVRTSPDHGTAFSLAGTGKASAGSLSAAMRLAVALAEPELV